MATAQDWIYMAFRKCGQLRPGSLPGADLLADALAEFGVLFDSYNAERTMSYTMPDYVFPVTGPGHGTTGNGQTFGGTGYQIGPTAADFVTHRPEVIVRMNLYMTSTSPTAPTRIPLAPLSMEEWMNIAVLQIDATNVTTCYAYDPQYPNGVIWLWPPLNGNALEIFTWGFLTPPALLSTVMALPPGYQDAIVWSLAERLWPLCDRSIMQNKLDLGYICGKKALALAKVRKVNAPMPRMASDFRGGRSNVGQCDWQLLLAGVPY